MIRKIIIQNKKFFAILIAVAIFFAAVLLLGANRIYDRESRWRHETASLELDFGKSVIQAFFTNLKHHLIFIRNSASIRNLVNSNFRSAKYQTEVETLFNNLIRASDELNQMHILDTMGQEIVKIQIASDGKPFKVDDKQLQNNNHRDYFHEALAFEESIYISPIDLKMEHGIVKNPPVAVVRVISTLHDKQGKKKGFLILTATISKLFQLLPKTVFIQTEAGSIVSLDNDGALEAVKSAYHFEAPDGILVVSNTETIHYTTVDLSSGRRFIAGLYHHHIGLKTAFQRLIWASAILFIIFLCLVFIISVLTFQQLDERNKAQMALLSSLVELTDFRDPQTGAHLLRTKSLSMQLARQLEKNQKFSRIITNEFIYNLYETAPLHDIGKVGIQDSILLKTGKLNAEEIQIMRKHTLIGRQILQDVIDQHKIRQPFIFMARNIAAFHHERFDGTGYPEGLKGDDIPLEARIFSLADVYDALRSERTYKESLSHNEVMRKIKSESGKHFDPDIVNAFLAIEKRFVEDLNSSILHLPQFSGHLEKPNVYGFQEAVQCQRK